MKKERNCIMNNIDVNNIYYMIMLSNGSFLKAKKELKREVFFINDQIIKKFNLKHTPSIIRQIGDKIEVKEIYIKNKGKK